MFLYSVHFRTRLAFNLSSNATNIIDTNSSLVCDEIETHSSQGTVVFLIVLVSLIILVTILGNTLVILAFIVDKRLRNQSNFFILNLAICDFFIGAFCIPLNVPFILTGKWVLGKFLCKLWLIADNIMCVASVFSVVLISYDRFLSVTWPVIYRSQQQRHSQTVLKMAAVWILSFLLYSPAILFWEYVDGANSISDGLCVPGYYYNLYFLLGASAFDFILPLMSISFFNLSIYWNIKRRSRKKRKMITSSILHTTDEKEIPMRPYIISGNNVLDGKEDFKTPTVKRFNRLLLLKQCFGKNSTLSSSQSKQVLRSNIHIIKLSRDKKVAKSLTILVCIFGVCWAPYTFLQYIRAACNDYCIDAFGYWYELVSWLLWINSSVNPVIYPLCHKSFRKALMKVCTCRNT
ncbi:histamine H3 receptor-like [Ascaphus truei]|uniref:histamine H3 receptor-like n=1 Tax=Ascaphus truei TaxID=8439 RepID=UPI003F5A07C0